MRDDYEDLGFYSYPNRTVCAILADMRKAYEYRNFSYLLAMIEEVQYHANRMESAIGDIKDIERFTKTRSELKSEIKKLIAEKKKLVKEASEKEKEKGESDE
jgi:hypothetical protein